MGYQSEHHHIAMLWPRVAAPLTSTDGLKTASAGRRAAGASAEALALDKDFISRPFLSAAHDRDPDHVAAAVGCGGWLARLLAQPPQHSWQDPQNTGQHYRPWLHGSQRLTATQNVRSYC